MRKTVHLLLIVTGLMCTLSSVAQNNLLSDTLDNMLIFSNERSGVAIAHSHGFGLGYRVGKNITSFRTRIFALEAVTMRSPKEIKTINPYLDNSKRYIYGKLNTVFVLRAAYSNKYLLNRKPYWGGVELRWLYEVGASMAFEKPYYLFVFNYVQLPSGEVSYEVVSSKFNSNNYSWDDIYGRAPFSKGLNEIRLVPGAYAKLGLNFEFGEVRTATRAAEIGVSLDVYPQTVRIMDDDRNQVFLLNFYISYAFGKRFNKY